MTNFAIALVVSVIITAASGEKLQTPFNQNILNHFSKTNRTGRIVGGKDVAPGELPYQISLRYYGSYIFGGSLVVVKGTQVVITAAQCVLGSASVYSVIAGVVDILDNSNEGQIRQIIRTSVHQNFNQWTLADDIAVLFIDSPFNLNANVMPIALPTKEQQTPGRVVVSGWGATSSGGSVSSILQKVEVPTIDDQKCQQMYPNEVIVDSMFCAGEGGKDSCQGDPGGPLRAVDGNYLAGIVSWGYSISGLPFATSISQGCASAMYPSVNTEVPYFIDWLNAQL